MADCGCTMKIVDWEAFDRTEPMKKFRENIARLILQELDEREQELIVAAETVERTEGILRRAEQTKNILRRALEELQALEVETS